jgi:hypothetical protein
MHRSSHSWLIAAGALLGLVSVAAVGAGSGSGRSLGDALRALQGPRFSVIFSSELVPDALPVSERVPPGDPLTVARALLKPHGLTLQQVGPGLYAVIADPAADAAGVSGVTSGIGEIVITASRYRLARDSVPGVATLTGAQLDSQPGFGEDALRGAQRLPGVVQNGLSASAYVRGGSSNETQVLLDGFPLREAFHLPGYQSFFSLIDPALIDRADIYTGGFPVRYGERMGAVYDLHSLAAQPPHRRALGLSFFNASARSAGDWGGVVPGDWLALGRIGTLRTLISAVDADIGLPSYGDLYARLRWRAGAGGEMSFNALLAGDELTIADEDRGERAQIDSDSGYLWLHGAWRPRAAWNWEFWLGHSRINSDKRGELLAAGIGSGMIADRRREWLWDLRLRGTWLRDSRQQIELGLDWNLARAQLQHQSAVEFSVDAATLFERPQGQTRGARLDPAQTNAALYVSHRWRISERIATEAGWRVQRAQNRGQSAATLVDPRVALRVAAGARSLWRASWGQFHQQDLPHELALADGLTDIERAQRTEQVIIGFEHQQRNGVAWRAEAFAKLQLDPRARYENQIDALALLPELAPDRVRIAPEHSELRGLELSAESRGQPWSWWAGYTWSEAFDEFRDVVVPRSWDQRHAFSGGLQWQRGPWGLGAVATVHSGWPTTRLLGGTAGGARLQARNGARAATYGALDLRASWQRQLDAGRFNLVLEVTNATNRLNPCCGKLLAVADGAGGYSISTRTQHWLPLLPSLAALWEF